MIALSLGRGASDTCLAPTVIGFFPNVTWLLGPRFYTLLGPLVVIVYCQFLTGRGIKIYIYIYIYITHAVEYIAVHWEARMVQQQTAFCFSWLVYICDFHLINARLVLAPWGITRPSVHVFASTVFKIRYESSKRFVLPSADWSLFQIAFCIGRGEWICGFRGLTEGRKIYRESNTFFCLRSAGAFNRVTDVSLALCMCMCDLPPKHGKKEINVKSACFSDQTNTRGQSGKVLACVCLCLCECYSPKAAIITDVLYTPVCLSLCAPFSCPLRNVDYRLGLVTVQQCEDGA